jgi:hypothetical protein
LNDVRRRQKAINSYLLFLSFFFLLTGTKVSLLGKSKWSNKKRAGSFFIIIIIKLMVVSKILYSLASLSSFVLLQQLHSRLLRYLTFCFRQDKEIIRLVYHQERECSSTRNRLYSLYEMHFKFGNNRMLQCSAERGLML